MRVIAGRHRGRPLKAPKGDATRPTTDRVRESLMSTIVSARGGLEGAVVLDAFAGSGALGVECLSRGARFAYFCERDRGALAALKQNTSWLESGEYRVAKCDVLAHPPRARDLFDVVFLDPPYALDASSVAGLVSALDSAGALAEDVIVSYEHDAKSSADAIAAFDDIKYCVITQKTYGETSIILFGKASA